VSNKTIKKVINTHKYSSHVARKKPMLSAVNIDRRLKFSSTDETKIMLYYHDALSKVWKKPNTALKQKNIIPKVKFGKLSEMVWGCISFKGVGEL